MAQRQSLQEKLLYEMEQGLYRGADRLPRESVLAEAMHVSRTQLRDALARLEREGYISRRQRIGTSINRHVLDLGVRMDLEVEFSHMVERSGYKPGVEIIGVEEGPAESYAAERLGLEPGEGLLCISRLVTADGRPAIFCEDRIPLRLIRDRRFTREELQQPIFAFLEAHCGIAVYMDLTRLRAVAADEALSGRLRVAKGAPLLHMDEVDYDIDGRPVLHAGQYYVDGIIRHSLIRRRF